ncbi:hypothetical protein E2C01_102452 [Portunus trituberculatus]|uniref:Uncharacterized protein n=1 Tax=Portunus trituberculatus TaxID=210409 RepID=A0A5B7KMM7_PORTR|nr:hypothetical protein [Portunus trituberculatus]
MTRWWSKARPGETQRGEMVEKGGERLDCGKGKRHQGPRRDWIAPAAAFFRRFGRLCKRVPNESRPR